MFKQNKSEWVHSVCIKQAVLLRIERIPQNQFRNQHASGEVTNRRLIMSAISGSELVLSLAA